MSSYVVMAMWVYLSIVSYEESRVIVDCEYSFYYSKSEIFLPCKL